MEKNIKFLKIMIVFIIIVIILILILMLLVLNNSNQIAFEDKKYNKEQVDIKYNKNSDQYNLIRFFEDKEYGILKSYEEFCFAEECLNKYIEYAINNKQPVMVMNLLDDEYKSQNQITTAKILSEYANYNEDDNYKYRANKIYSRSKSGIHIYYVYGYLIKNDFEKLEKIKDLNCGVIIDFNNYTFSIIPNISEDNFNKYAQIKNIKKNTDNSAQIKVITNEATINRYAKFYINELNIDINNAYELLDEEYKNKRFNNNIEKFKQYIEENYYVECDVILVNKKRNILKNELYSSFYIAYDEFSIPDDTIMKDKNYITRKNIILKENAANIFKVLLDRYTIITDIAKNEYNNLSEEEKVIYNCENIIDSIQTEYYEYSFEHLSDLERKKYNTLSEYENYISLNNLKGLYNNDDYIIEKKGNSYIYKSNFQGVHTNEKKQVIIEINLKQDMDFEISVDIV